MQQQDDSLDLRITLENPSHEKSLDVSAEFLKQNEVISQEIRKHDQLLSTCSMIIFRIWIVFYILHGLLFSLLLIPFNSLLAAVFQISEYILLPLITALIIIALFSIYATFLLWTGILSKDLLKVERCLSIFKLYFGLLTLVVFLMMIRILTTDNWSWSSIQQYFIVGSPSLINALLATHVRNILVQRNVFSKYSNSDN